VPAAVSEPLSLQRRPVTCDCIVRGVGRSETAANGGAVRMESDMLLAGWLVIFLGIAVLQPVIDPAFAAGQWWGGLFLSLAVLWGVFCWYCWLWMFGDR